MSPRFAAPRSAPLARCPMLAGVLVAVAMTVGPVLPGLPSASPAHAQRAFNAPPSLAPLAERLSEAVVNISTSQAAKGPQGVPLPQVPKGSPFEDLFEDFFERRGRQGAERKVSSLGSGVVVDPAGLIVTNNHVIEGADEIIINFVDGTKLKVEKVIGRDPKTDLALLKVTPKKPLKAAPLGASAKMQVGDWVLAIGNPFGLGGSVTLGIISAKQRDINSGPYDDYLQTDAAINKGNSGGPLFNMDGEVIGINTAIISPTGGSIGIGFSVPSDTVQAVVDQLKQWGEVRRGWLGVQLQTVTDEIAETMGLPEATGALVASITPDSPAAKGGLQGGDVILRFDGKDVTRMRGLPRIVAQTGIGRTVDVEVLRDKGRRTLAVTIGRLIEDEPKVEPAAAQKAPDRPAEGAAPPAAGPPDGVMAGLTAVPGLTLAPLDDALRKRFGLDAKVSGVAVVAIDPDSAAAQKSVKIGDVVVEAAQQPVKSLDDVVAGVERVKKAGRKAILLRLEDAKGDLRFVAVPLG